VSDTAQGEGWWLASDGTWYPPTPIPDDPRERAVATYRETVTAAESTYRNAIARAHAGARQARAQVDATMAQARALAKVAKTQTGDQASATRAGALALVEAAKRQAGAVSGDARQPTVTGPAVTFEILDKALTEGENNIREANARADVSMAQALAGAEAKIAQARVEVEAKIAKARAQAVATAAQASARPGERKSGVADVAKAHPRNQINRKNRTVGKWTSESTVGLIALIGLVLLIGGCVALVATHKQHPVVSSPTANDSLGTNGNYLSVIHAEAPSAVNSYSDADLVALGQVICHLLDTGVTGDTITASREATVTAYDMGVVEGAAAVNFCPNREAYLNNSTTN
jgi:hypothetical protein